MSSGGARKGAGRKAGQKDKTPRGTPDRDYSDSEASKLKALLSLGIKAKRKFYQDLMFRVANQDRQQKPLSLAEMKYMEKIGEELAEKPVTGPGEGEEPLEFMLRIMNDPNQPEEYRARMAVSAAPFCHDRKGEGLGKKEEKNERAKSAGAGRFRASAPPLKLVGKK